MAKWPRIKGIISDIDGVVCRGNVPVAGAAEAFRNWREAKIPYVFFTNNSTKTAREFAEKLRGFGISVSADQVVSTAEATATFLRRKWPLGTGMLVVGARSLRESVKSAGMKLDAENPAAVVVGLDREINYAKLRAASRAVLSGAKLIGTNPDLMLPASDGFDPGAGSILAAIDAASGRKGPAAVIGKPEPFLVELALERLKTPRQQTIVVGDQVCTDILAGRNARLATVLVQTGVPQGDTAMADFVIEDLGEIPLYESRCSGDESETKESSAL